MLKKNLALSIVIVAAMLVPIGGNTSPASDCNISIESLIAMPDAKLIKLPQETLQAVLDNASKERVLKSYKLKDLRRITDQYSLNAYQNMVDEIGSKPPDLLRASSLAVGSSASVSLANDGDCGYAHWGVCGLDCDYNGEIGEARIWAGPGYGSADAWAMTGHTFCMTGQGYGFYKIKMNCEWACGSLSSGNNILSLWVEEWRGGNYDQYSFLIDEYSSFYGYHSDSFEHSIPSYVMLYADATYRFSLHVLTTGTAFLFDVVEADCMAGDLEACWDYLSLEYVG